MQYDTRKSIVPLVVFGVCGFAGMAVDVFDAIAIVTPAPRWLHTLDLLAAVCYTVAICCVGTYINIRYN